MTHYYNSVGHVPKNISTKRSNTHLISVFFFIYSYSSWLQLLRTKYLKLIRICFFFFHSFSLLIETNSNWYLKVLFYASLDRMMRFATCYSMIGTRQFIIITSCWCNIVHNIHLSYRLECTNFMISINFFSLIHFTMKFI